MSPSVSTWQCVAQFITLTEEEIANSPARHTEIKPYKVPGTYGLWGRAIAGYIYLPKVFLQDYSTVLPLPKTVLTSIDERKGLHWDSYHLLGVGQAGDCSSDFTTIRTDFLNLILMDTLHCGSKSDRPQWVCLIKSFWILEWPRVTFHLMIFFSMCYINKMHIYEGNSGLLNFGVCVVNSPTARSVSCFPLSLHSDQANSLHFPWETLSQFSWPACASMWSFSLKMCIFQIYGVGYVLSAKCHTWHIYSKPKISTPQVNLLVAKWSQSQRILNSFDMSKEVLRMVQAILVKSVINYWYRNLGARSKSKLVVNTANKITWNPQSELVELYTKQTKRKATVIN